MVDKNGKVRKTITDHLARLDGDHSVWNRAIVVSVDTFQRLEGGGV